jgi:hypothetical protein
MAEDSTQRHFNADINLNVSEDDHSTVGRTQIRFNYSHPIDKVNLADFFYGILNSLTALGHFTLEEVEEGITEASRLL